MLLILFIILFISVVLNVYLFVKVYDYEGDILIGWTDQGKKMFSLDIDKNPDHIETMKVVRFRVVKEEESNIAE